ncbi:MAG: apolipoprotein N-acyltransferase, partial [Octadecabacter sp.]
MTLHPRDLSTRFAASPRIVRRLVPIGLGAFAALGHEAWMSGVLAVTAALVVAFLIVPDSR